METLNQDKYSSNTSKIVKQGGKNRIRLTDVAKDAGVSLATVARVLNNAGGNVRVSLKTSQKIKRVAKKLGYIPNFAARQLAGGRSRMLSAIIDTNAPWNKYSQLAAVSTAMKEHNLDLLITQIHDDMEAIRQHSKAFISRGIEGVICFAHDYPGVGTEFREIFSGFKHVIFVDSPAVVDQEIHFVGLDHADAARKAVNCLVRIGRKKIAFLSLASMAYQTIRDFCGGYREGLAENAIKFDHNLLRCLGVIHEHKIFPSNFVPVIQELITKHKIDGIVTTSGICAASAIKSLKLEGLTVPEDVAVVAIDDNEFLEYYEPSLTAFTWDNIEIGRRIAEMAAQMYNNQEIPEKQILIKPELILRDSTAY